MSIELAGCPFCGKEPMGAKNINLFYKKPTWAISCVTCRFRITAKTKNLVSENWNKRS